jgi:uncharacterized membrane protein YbhN (UPF0104 family)
VDLPGGDEAEATPSLRASVRRSALTLLLLAILTTALVASVPGLRGALNAIANIDPVWMVAAVALELASDVSFVVLFRLFFDRLAGPEARLLAWTEQGSGALLPGGSAGGFAVGAWLIHLTGAPMRWIARRSGGLFFVSTAVSSTALIGAGLALIAGAAGPHAFSLVVLPTVFALSATLLIAALPRILRSRPNAPRWLRAISAGVEEAERVAFQRPSWRLAGALGYLGFDMAVLWTCLRAVGQAPTVPALLLAYIVGYVTNVLPVPGGIGVLDAGLTGTVMLYGGISPAHAAAAVLVYHAIAFLVPGLGGLLAYVRLRPRLLRLASTRPSAADTPNQLQPEQSSRGA